MDDLYDLGRPFATVPDFIYNVLIKFRLMADEKQGSPVFPKSLFQGILSVCIQVIGGLIQKQDVGIPVDQFAQADLRLLASAQYPHLALDVLGSQAAFGKGGADFILVKGRKLLPDFFNAGRLVVIIHILLEVAGQYVLS